MSRIKLLGYYIEDNINKILQVCWLLTSGDGEENGYVIGSWDGQMLWEAEVRQDFYEPKTDSDLTKTQNSQVNNLQKNLLQLYM